MLCRITRNGGRIVYWSFPDLNKLLAVGWGSLSWWPWIVSTGNVWLVQSTKFLPNPNERNLQQRQHSFSVNAFRDPFVSERLNTSEFLNSERLGCCEGALLNRGALA
jgi:hypothetical protein